MEEDIKIVWEQLNCEACWQEDISTCKNCEWKCRQFKAFENILNELERLKTENSNITRELLARTNKLNELLGEEK